MIQNRSRGCNHGRPLNTIMTWHRVMNRGHLGAIFLPQNNVRKYLKKPDYNKMLENGCFFFFPLVRTIKQNIGSLIYSILYRCLI